MSDFLVYYVVPCLNLYILVWAVKDRPRRPPAWRKCPNCGKRSHFIHEPHVLRWDHEKEA